ncbi:MAG: hypothetical protein ABJA67_15100 [Chthonomonadales bacterium]
MELIVAAIADSANVSDMGKMNILGIFDALLAPFTPIVLKQFSVALVLRPDEDEKGTTKLLRIQINDADGRSIISEMTSQIVVATAEIGIRPPVNLVLTIQDLLFPKFGDYEIKIDVDHVNLKTISFLVQPVFQSVQS